jgi:hypothetical protein
MSRPICEQCLDKCWTLGHITWTYAEQTARRFHWPRRPDACWTVPSHHPRVGDARPCRAKRHVTGSREGYRCLSMYTAPAVRPAATTSHQSATPASSRRLRWGRRHSPCARPAVGHQRGCRTCGVVATSPFKLPTSERGFLAPRVAFTAVLTSRSSQCTAHAYLHIDSHNTSHSHIARIERPATWERIFKQPMDGRRSHDRDPNIIGAGAGPQSKLVTRWRSILWGGT